MARTENKEEEEAEEPFEQHLLSAKYGHKLSHFML